MRSAVTPPAAPAITNEQVTALAAKVGVDVVRLAPGWQWFIKNADGTKKMIGKTGAQAWEVLEKMLPKEPVKAAKKLRLWMGSGVGVVADNDPLLQGDAADVKVFACAPSRAALVRMLQTYRGFDKPSMAYRIKTHWVEKWDLPMAGMAPDVGVWLQYAPGTKPERAV